MLFLKHKLLIAISVLSFALLQSCNLNGYEEDEADEVWEEENNEEVQEKGPLSIWDIRDLALGYEGAEEVNRDIALWGYESGYTWLEGEHFRDSSILFIDVKKEIDNVSIKFDFELAPFLPYPIVYDYKFKKDDEADYLHVDLIIRNNHNSKKITISEKTSLFGDGGGSFETDLELADFSDFPAGNVEYTVELKTVFTSFFDIRSKISPLNAKFSFNFEVPQLYRTVFAFKALKLNKKETDRKLGSDNDFSNPTPEAGIRAKYRGNTFFYGFAENSYNYLKAKKTDVFHLDPDVNIDIEIIDVDYGFNFSDNLCDTSFSLKSIEGTDYFKLKMKCVDELLIYSQYKGKAN